MTGFRLCGREIPTRGAGASIPTGQRTPTTTLNLQPGELVRVKSYKEILATLDQNNKNRGLYFDAEVVPFCGGIYRVLKRVTKDHPREDGQDDQLEELCHSRQRVLPGSI